MTARTAQWANVLDAAAADLVAKTRANAQAFNELGRPLSRDLALNFAAEIEAGAPAGLYRHWINEQGARVEGIRGANAARQWAGGYR